MHQRNAKIMSKYDEKSSFLFKIEVLDTRSKYPGTRVVKKGTNYPGTRVLDTRHWKH